MKNKLLLLALCSFYHLNAVEPIGARIKTAISDEQDNLLMMGKARRVLNYLCDRKDSNLDTATRKALEEYGLMKGDDVNIGIAAYRVRYQYTHLGLVYTMERINR